MIFFSFWQIHLNDIGVDNTIIANESKLITPGNRLSIYAKKFKSRTLKIGLGIGQDLWFPELAQAYKRKGLYVDTLNL